MTDDVATQRLPPLRVVTRRIDDAFGDGGPLSERRAEQLQVVAARVPSLYPSVHPPSATAAARWGTTARWPPTRRDDDMDDRGAMPTARSPVSRPAMAPTLASWSEAVTRRSVEDSMLGAAVRALAEGASAPANEAWPASEVESDADPAFRRRECLRQLGPLDQAPRSTVASHEIRSMGLEHRQAFVLSFADGVSSFEDIVDSCGMDEVDALEVLCQLLDSELLVLDPTC